MSGKPLDDILAQIADQPRELWPALVRARIPDAGTAAQAIIWLEANGADDDSDDPPALADDRYRLGVLLDVGATASVWQAHDKRLGRDVAIKVFRTSRTPALRELLAEARAAAEVISDHVVRVLDVHAGEPSYIVMELVAEHEPRRGALAPGGSAAALRPTSVAEGMRWVRDVARGVHDAHLRNVFHRDLKPHNVLITPISRRAKVGDFGLAISGHGGRGPNMAGTPGYIAPEQARGIHGSLDPHDLDERSLLIAIDVWGLGAIAYDFVAGRSPWCGEPGPDAREAWEVAASGEEPLPLAGIPGRLRRVIAKAMHLDPRLRYASAAELADDLDAYLARRPTSLDRARPVRFGLWCRRNPQLSIAALLAIVLAGIAGVAYANVVEVREQRNTLADEAARTEAAYKELEIHTAEAKKRLAATEADLDAKSASLDLLEKTLAEASKDYKAIVTAKERALANADEATRQLAEELSAVRGERDVAQTSSGMYQGFWERARTDADQANKDKDVAVAERDAARKERDQVVSERDVALAKRLQLEKDRDVAVGERDRAEAARRRAELDVARLAAQLAALTGAGSGTGSASGSGGSGSGSASGSGGGGSGSGSSAAAPISASDQPRP